MHYKEHQHPIEIVHTPDQQKQTWKSFWLPLWKKNCLNVVGYRKTHGSYNNKPINIVREKLDRDLTTIRVFFYLRNSKNGIQQTPFSLIPIGHVTNPFRKFILCFTRWESNHWLPYRQQQPRHKDGVVIIEHKEGDLLMMECSDWFFIPILKQIFSKSVMLNFYITC
jgi:thiamine pyrophosphokinase